MSYTPESFDALLDAVFHRHGARLPRQRIIERIRSACCRRWWNPPRCALVPAADRRAAAVCLPPAAAGAAKSGQPTQLNIVTRRNSILSAAAHAFIDTLVRTLR